MYTKQEGSKLKRGKATWKILMLLCIGFVFSLHSLAQHKAVIIKGGTEKPIEIANLTWYFDTLAHRAWRWEKDHWFEFSSAVVADLIPCHNLLLVLMTNGSYLGYKAWGSPIGEFNECMCLDSIHWILEASTFYVATNKGEIVMDIEAWCYTAHKNQMQMQQLADQQAFCVPRWRKYMSSSCDNIRTWGMLGANGEWVVEPKFDAPFRFQDGFADVIYYGQRRKINEKGEFVE